MKQLEKLIEENYNWNKKNNNFKWKKNRVQCMLGLGILILF